MSKDPVREFAQSEGNTFVYRREVLQLLVSIDTSLKTVIELGKKLRKEK